MTVNVETVDAVVVGGGFGGIRTVDLFKNRLGFDKVVGVEKGSALGGAWFWNQYPGAQTDTEAWVYRFSDDRSEPNWTSRYLKAEQLQEQIHDTATKSGVAEEYIFDNSVVSAHYDEDAKRWNIRTDQGRQFSATYFVTALGILTNPYVPDWPGKESFQGIAFHSARWPKDLDVTGKRIAVVGTGPSGSQIVANIHPLAKEVTVFQRRAQYVVPINNREVDEAEKQQIWANYDAVWDTVFNSLFAMGFVEGSKSALEVSEAERREVYERAWNEGSGFRFFFETFSDIATSEEANETAAAFVRSKIASIVEDPKTAALLQPTGLYGGRPLSVDGYYEAFNEPHVSLVDISENEIAEITLTGVKLRDGQTFDADVIVYATGFDGVDGAYRNIDITGRHGVKLFDAWKDESNALYGVSVSGFPNFFTVTGPGGPFANMLPTIELQAGFIAELVEEARARQQQSVEANAEAQVRWAATVQEISKLTVFDKVKSWIQNNNVEGKKKYSAFFLGGLQTYVDKLGEEAKAKYPSFEFSS